MKLTEDVIRKKLHVTYTNDYIDVKGAAERSHFVKDDSELICAAVLIPLVYLDSDWSIVFTRRTQDVESHKGQVAFPGGACDLNELQPEQTALRETWEEIGIRPQDIHLLGRMNNIITITNFRVSPVVGMIPWMSPFNISQQEVSRVFRIPLDWLIDPSNWSEEKFFLEGMKNEHSVIKYHPYDGEILWGATARITHNFLRILNLM